MAYIDEIRAGRETLLVSHPWDAEWYLHGIPDALLREADHAMHATTDREERNRIWARCMAHGSVFTRHSAGANDALVSRLL